MAKTAQLAWFTTARAAGNAGTQVPLGSHSVFEMKSTRILPGIAQLTPFE